MGVINSIAHQGGFQVTDRAVVPIDECLRIMSDIKCLQSSVGQIC